MRRRAIFTKVFCTTLFMAVAVVEGCRMKSPEEHEKAAPPDRFVVTTAAGLRHTGPAAKVEIKHLSLTQPPHVEVTFSASNSSGSTWAAQAVAPPDFLETLTLSAQVVDRPLETGQASVQVSSLGGETSFASSGLLKLRLQAGWLTGDASGMSNDLSARFEGPFVVTCAVPASMTSEAPAPAENSAQPSLVVDEKFASELCKRYATFGH